LSELAAFVKGLTDDEGIVIKYANGLFVKIKADDYVLKHRALDGLRSEKDVAALILNDLLDDVLPIVDEKLRERLVNYRASLWQNILDQEDQLQAAWLSIKHLKGNRAEFAREATKHTFRQFLFKMLDGKKVSLREYALLKTGSNASVEENRWLFGKPYLEF
jgi:RNA ligase